MDESAWEIIKDLDDLENTDTIKFKCEKLIEETYSFGLLLILAIFELQKNGSKMIRFRALAQSLSEKDLIKLYKIERDNMTKKNSKNAKKVIKDVHSCNGIVKNIKYMFI